MPGGNDDPLRCPRLSDELEGDAWRIHLSPLTPRRVKGNQRDYACGFLVEPFAALHSSVAGSTFPLLCSLLWRPFNRCGGRGWGMGGNKQSSTTSLPFRISCRRQTNGYRVKTSAEHI